MLQVNDTLCGDELNNDGKYLRFYGWRFEKLSVIYIIILFIKWNKWMPCFICQPFVILIWKMIRYFDIFEKNWFLLERIKVRALKGCVPLGFLHWLLLLKGIPIEHNSITSEQYLQRKKILKILDRRQKIHKEIWNVATSINLYHQFHIA